MRKESLKKLRTLAATPKMMQMAQADKPEKITRRWSGEPEYHYETCLYMRCQQLEGILKIAFFFPHLMRMGSNRAAYELFINRATGEFLTYDVQSERWREAKLDMLEWPSYCRMDDTRKWINKEGHHSIKQYLGVDHGGYRGILEYQISVREEQLKQRYKKETGPWDLAMEQIPPLPKDWLRWVDKVGITQHHIFYQYKRNGPMTGYCTWCEKEVRPKNPRHNKSGKCPCCGHIITYKAEGKAGNFYTKQELAYLLQRCESGFVVRSFSVHHRYSKGKYRTPQRSLHECCRVIYDKNLYGDSYWYGDYKQHEVRWVYAGRPCRNYRNDGRVYGKTIPMLAKSDLNRTGLQEMVKSLVVIDPVWWIESVRKKPWLEQLAKAGLTRLAYDAADDYYWEKEHLQEGRELHKRLGLDRRQLRRLRESNGGSLFLKWLSFEKTTGRQISDRVITWMEREKIVPGDMDFIRKRMSETQVSNYLQRQMAETGETSRQILRTWADYLSMAKRLKMDTSDAIIYRCKKLRQRHDELVARFVSKEVAIQAVEYAKKFPHVDDVCKAVKEKYELAGDVYTVLAPSCIEDIINEGRALNHCVGKSERYFERIETHEAYVLFLRKSEEPDKPYYTLEIEPGGTVRQKRTMFDRQNDDIKAAEKFLRVWQKEIRSRLTTEDIQLAEESRERRILGYAEIRANGLQIPTGDLRGQLLADVLQADLMEVLPREKTGKKKKKEANVA